MATDAPSLGNYADLYNVAVNVLSQAEGDAGAFDWHHLQFSGTLDILRRPVTAVQRAARWAIVDQIQDVYNGFGQLTQEYQNPTGAVDYLSSTLGR